MGVTSIEWTDRTWNPTVGCTKVSTGCKLCYAKTLHDQRHKAHGEGKAVPAQYAHPFEVLQLMPDRLRDPLAWKKPQRVFVNSVSDLFHEDVPFGFIANVFAIMQLAEQHTFQVLTKRPERMRAFFETHRHWSGEIDTIAKTVDDAAIQWAEGQAPNQRAWPLPNVWLGVSVENQTVADERIPHLIATPAAVRFLSCEPLLGPVNLNRWLWEFDPDASSDIGAVVDTPAGKLGWVIVGGESGRDARPMNPLWARSLRDQCVIAGVPFFFKQWGEYGEGYVGMARCETHKFNQTGWDGVEPIVYRVGKKTAGRLLDGRTWDEFPVLA